MFKRLREILRNLRWLLGWTIGLSLLIVTPMVLAADVPPEPPTCMVHEICPGYVYWLSADCERLIPLIRDMLDKDGLQVQEVRRIGTVTAPEGFVIFCAPKPAA